MPIIELVTPNKMIRIKFFWENDSFKGGLLLILCLVGLRFSLFGQVDSIKYWNGTKTLHFTDFKGSPTFDTLDFSAASVASIHFSVELEGDSIFVVIKPVFFLYESWMINKQINLLDHENYHFNLYELHARIFRESVAIFFNKNKEKELTYNAFREVIDKDFWRTIDSLDAKQFRYDESTGHGVIIENQKEWEGHIDSLLNFYVEYSDTLMKFRFNRVN